MASRFQPPPIVDAARRLCADVEQVVRTFPRYHRYQTGAELRRRADAILILASRTWHRGEGRLECATQLVDAIDAFKERLQVCKLVRAFQRFAQFERLAGAAHDLGMQAGGWKRSIEQHPNAQNARAGRPAQRGEKLSTRDARQRAKS
ncbi:hypothetical protein [Luteimonas sp. FCS-9]|uniref:hypothetical protein n=1 Tax=Luteimonas sp. FCS-9 TaxID=1547516 RepID=UPI00063E8A52|nr:hypothetical protein [Luteimonas sp. FCS-9]KLJ02858.1 hypothetical protein WQ56_00830 [Luteimonas sp. FCS-9]